MDQRPLNSLISSLSRPAAFPAPVDSVTVRQTHISAVFLSENLVYKVKKAVHLPFLDFSTLERRQHFCNEEVRVNSPWAPGIYLGTAPVTEYQGELSFEGRGTIVDWAVKMHRINESDSLLARVRADVAPAGTESSQALHGMVRKAAAGIAAIHRACRILTSQEAAASLADFYQQVIANLDFSDTLSEDFLTNDVRRRLRDSFRDTIEQRRSLLAERANTGWAREVHGDLRLDHMIVAADGSLVVLDGIEFDPSLRCTDVLGDIGFASMELSFLGRSDLAKEFSDSWFQAAGDTSGPTLLPLFMSYRSAVRAKVAAILAQESEVPAADRMAAIARSRAHWLWSLGALESPARRPLLILVSGLPGTGKSTLARQLATRANVQHIIRTDIVRREIFPDASGPDTKDPLYSADRTKQTYDECRRRAETQLRQGQRVIVDATFHQDFIRCEFLSTAVSLGVKPVWIECRTDEGTAAQRLRDRRGDASDADWTVYELIRSRWEPPGYFSTRFHHWIDTGHTAAEAADAAQSIILRPDFRH